MSAEATTVEDSISNQREAEVAEAVRWLIDRYGFKQTEAQLLFALGILRRLEYEEGP